MHHRNRVHSIFKTLSALGCVSLLISLLAKNVIAHETIAPSAEVTATANTTNDCEGSEALINLPTPDPQTSLNVSDSSNEEPQLQPMPAQNCSSSSQESSPTLLERVRNFLWYSPSEPGTPFSRVFAGTRRDCPR